MAKPEDSFGPRSKLCKQFGYSATYPNIVFQLNPSGRVQPDLLQRFAHDIVGLVLALLRGLNGRRLVQIPLVVDIELPERIGKAVDVALLELRELSVVCGRLVSRADVYAVRRSWLLPLKLEDLHADFGEGVNRRGNVSLSEHVD
jgi:hypothetical protein